MESLNDDLVLYNAFAEAAYLNKKHDPWYRRRKPGEEYYIVEIVNTEDAPDNHWYKPFEGVKYMATKRSGTFVPSLLFTGDEFIAVAFSGTTMLHQGNGVPAYFCRLL